MGRDSYYDILGVSPAATCDEIRAKYRNLSLRIHPDHDGPVALFRQVQEAYEVLSDPVRRASYDRLLASRVASGMPLDPKAPRNMDPFIDRNRHGARPGTHPQRQHPSRTLSRHPVVPVATAGAILLVLGVALGPVGTALIVLGAAALVLAGIAKLGGRGAKERAAYQQSGMTAIDAMTGRQFEALLEHFFAKKGYRVARIYRRHGESWGDLLLNDARGRIIVHANGSTGVVRDDAVQEAMAAMAMYGAARALVVTSSDYSQNAVTVAHSNGVTLWNRTALAAELTVFRVDALQSGVKRLASELRAGSRICLGFFALLLVALAANTTRVRRRAADMRRRARG